MKSVKIITIFLGLLFLCSCSPLEKKTDEEYSAAQEISAEQLQHKWILYKIDGQLLTKKITSTLNISTKNKAAGTLVCNYFVGIIDLQKDQLKINNMASTKKSCRSERGEIETIISTVLNNYSQISLVEKQLKLIGKSHHLLYKYQQN